MSPNDEDMGYLEDKAARIDLDVLKAELGVDAFALGRDGVEALRPAPTSRPRTSRASSAGYTGKGTKTIVPSEARVRMDFRLIPNISPGQGDREAARASRRPRASTTSRSRARRGPRIPTRSARARTSPNPSSPPRTRSMASRPSSTASRPRARSCKHVWIPCVLTGLRQPRLQPARAGREHPHRQVHQGHQVRRRHHGTFRPLLTPAGRHRMPRYRLRHLPRLRRHDGASAGAGRRPIPKLCTLTSIAKSHPGPRRLVHGDHQPRHRPGARRSPASTSTPRSTPRNTRPAPPRSMPSSHLLTNYGTRRGGDAAGRPAGRSTSFPASTPTAPNSR